MPGRLRQARLATSLIFLVHGLLVSTWVSRIPAVQKQLALSEGILGTALLGIALGSVAAMPVAGYFITRLGSRTVTTWTTFLFCVAVALIPAAPGALSLSAVLVIYGAAAGSMDVAMNAQGVVIENSYSRSIMSSFHALFSIGGMVGALAGGWIAQAGVPVATHLPTAALVCSVTAAAIYPRMLSRDEEPPAHSGPAFSVPRGPVLMLGALGFCILICEGAMADWIAIFLRDSLSAGPALAASGYGVFSAAMSVGRLAGDRVTDRLGPVLTVRGGALIAAAGLSAALLIPSKAAVLTAFVAVGLGYAAIVPNVFAASGRVAGVPRGTAIAAVTTMGYFGFLVGPPLIGWLAEWISLRHALFVLVALTLAGGSLANAVRAANSHIATVYEPDVRG